MPQLQNSNYVNSLIVPVWEKYQTDIEAGFKKIANFFAWQMVFEVRASNPGAGKDAINKALGSLLDAYLEKERIILKEKSHIEETTTDKIVDIVRDGAKEKKTIKEMQQAISDSGTFSPERSLRIARTMTGTGASLGQLHMGVVTGATHKYWRAAGHQTRKQHLKRNNEKRKINETFSRQYAENIIGPMYPGDPNICASDRINCRCWSTFTIEGKRQDVLGKLDRGEITAEELLNDLGLLPVDSAIVVGTEAIIETVAGEALEVEGVSE